MPRLNSRISECHVCGKQRPCEREHVWPIRFGGVSVAPICTSCHDAIDRMRNIDALGEEGVTGLFELTRTLGLSWCTQIMNLDKQKGDTTVVAAYRQLLEAWDSLTSAGRIVGSRLLRALLDQHAARCSDEPAFVAEFCEHREFGVPSVPS